MNKNRHLISKYLEGELDPITAARFEEDLRSDPLLQQELELYKEVDEALADTDLIELRMQLRDIHTRLAPETTLQPRAGIKWITRVGAAASLAVLLGLGTYTIIRMNSSQYLFNKYYQPYELTSANRSGVSETDLTLREAMLKYQNQEYREAVLLFEKVLTADPDQMATQLYTGISYFEIEEYRKAGNSFTKVIEQNDNLYIEQARWYLGFCYLKTEEKEKAIRQFREISSSKGYYSEKAKAILKRLQ